MGCKCCDCCCCEKESYGDKLRRGLTEREEPYCVEIDRIERNCNMMDRQRWDVYLKDKYIHYEDILNAELASELDFEYVDTSGPGLHLIFDDSIFE